MYLCQLSNGGHFISEVLLHVMKSLVFLLVVFSTTNPHHPLIQSILLAYVMIGLYSGLYTIQCLVF